MSTTIFISYRREDGAGYAGRLFDQFASCFGTDRIFMDIESNHLGDDWIENMTSAIKSCFVFVVVIGPSWRLTLEQRMASKVMDPVHFEIASALRRTEINVIPVLVGGAKMPPADSLPDDLVGLSRRHALPLSDSHFRADCAELINSVQSTLTPQVRRPAHQVHIPLSVANMADVVAWGWTGRLLMDVLISLEFQAVEGLTAEYAGTADQWTPVLVDHPDSWRILTDRPGSIAGNWHFIALYEDDFEAARKGRLCERDITADRVRYIDVPGWYDIYFLAAFLLPRFRQLANLQLLRTSLLDHFVYLATQGVFVRNVCTNAFTREGEALCRSFDMIPTVPHSQQGRMYERSFYPLPNTGFCAQYRLLNDLYEDALASSGRFDIRGTELT